MTKSLDAPDVEALAKLVVDEGAVGQIDLAKVRFIRSFGAAFASYARIFGLPQPVREALKTDIRYVVEVNAKLFDGLPEHEKIRVVIHELTHIPDRCDGSLRPHSSPSFRSNTQRKARRLAAKLKSRGLGPR